LRRAAALTAISRIKSVDYTLRGGIKVYETTFAFQLHDNSMLDGLNR
jgi:hypothetical protein